MAKNKKLFLIIGCFVLLMLGAGWFYKNQSQNVNTPDTNETEKEPVYAVDFNVQNKDGKNTYFSDFYDGKPIILNFFSSTCQPCRLEMPDFMELYETYKDEVHFVMIDCVGSLGETKEKAEEFLKENEYTFPVYFDVNKNAVTTYGVMSFPTTYVFDGEHILVAGGSGMIDKDIVINVFDKVLQK